MEDISTSKAVNSTTTDGMVMSFDIYQPGRGQILKLRQAVK